MRHPRKQENMAHIEKGKKSIKRSSLGSLDVGTYQIKTSNKVFQICPKNIVSPEDQIKRQKLFFK